MVNENPTKPNPPKVGHYSIDAYRDPTVVEAFDRERFGGPVGEFFRIADEQVIWSMIRAPQGLKILDLGAGTGRLTIPLARRKAIVVAADASPAMLQIAIRKGREEGLEFYTVINDAHDLPFPDRTFDFVISTRMLMHVKDWRGALSEMCRVSVHGVIIDYPPRTSFAGLAPLVLPLKKLLKPKTQVYSVFRAAEIEAVLKSRGFFIEDLQKQFSLPFFVHRLLRRPALSGKLEHYCRSKGVTDRIGAPVVILAIRQDPE